MYITLRFFFSGKLPVCRVSNARGRAEGSRFYCSGFDLYIRKKTNGGSAIRLYFH